MGSALPEDRGHITKYSVMILWILAHTACAHSLPLPVFGPRLLTIHPCAESARWVLCNWAGNSLSSCRGCNRKRKNLLVSISFISDGYIHFLSRKKTLHPKKSLSVESCCVSASPGCTAASYLSCHLCETWSWWEAASEQSASLGGYFLQRSQAQAHSMLLSLCTKEGG